MKLGLKDIKNITFGAVNIEESDKGIHFYRFSKTEEKFYEGSTLFQKVFASAGVVMEFTTDAEALKLAINVSEGSSRTYFACDFFVNNKFIGDIRNYTDCDKSEFYVGKEFQLGRHSGEFELGSGVKTVKIVFPWSVSTTVEEMTLDGATFIEGVKKEKSMILYGDSITQGYDTLSPSKSYAAKLADKLDAHAINKACGGDVYRAGLAAAGESISPDYITVAYGTNDWFTRRKAEFFEECEGFLKGLSEKYDSSKIFVISPIWRKDKNELTEFGPFEDVELIIKDICNSLGNIVFISGRNFLPEDEAVYADLRLHPNDAGFAYYFDSLLSAIKNYI